MRQERTQQTPAPAPKYRAATELPASGYVLIVDGQVKSIAPARAALRGAMEGEDIGV